MIKQILLLCIACIVIALTSCKSTTSKHVYQKSPSNLAELHDGFYDTELSPETHQFNNTKITIVATGHIYPLLKYPLAFESFVSTIKEQNPDYVFILGDIVYDNTQKEWDIFFSFFYDLKHKLFFSPGNHDLNFQHERNLGIIEHQFEAEQRYIDNIGYRYKILKDNMANYVFINMNDSLKRVLTYLDIINPELDINKPLLLLSSQCIWHNKYQDPENLKTWANQPFKRKEIMPHLVQFDYLIHGDWGGNFYRSYWTKGKGKGKFQVMGVGNRMNDDSLYISRLDIFQDTIISYSVSVPVPIGSSWYK